VLVPQQGERETERQAASLAAAARTAGVTDSRALAPLMEQAVEAGSNVIWMRLLDPESGFLAQAGTPQGAPTVPRGWWQRVEGHASLGHIVQTTNGKTYVAMLPFRMPRPPHGPPPGAQSSHEARNHAPPGRRTGAYMLDIAIPLDSVAGAFAGLRNNVLFGLCAAVALLLSVVVIGVRTLHYLRGKYLDRGLQLARRVQNDLVSPSIDFAVSATAADQVGGDFHDIFETTPGGIAIVLGDVSGKGIPAALPASVLHGAIRPC